MYFSFSIPYFCFLSLFLDESEEKHKNFNNFIEELLKKKPGIDSIGIKEEDFLEALKNIKPSVSIEELNNYKFLQEKYAVKN